MSEPEILLTPASFNVQCSCGKPHEISLKKAVIASGAMLGIDDILAQAGLPLEYTAVYDENTYMATTGRRPAAKREVILKADHLHADEKGVQALQGQLADTGLLLAVGAGTVHDITRYVAAQRDIPFVSVPTAASVDGFVSTVAAMTWDGFKVTMPAVAPRLLVADLDVVAAAPAWLAASGFGDVVGKYTALADWEISHLITGEYYCDGIAQLAYQAMEEAILAHEGLVQGAKDSFASLLKALVLSGVAMQLAGNSRPASGAEHHVSHLIEIGVPWLPPSSALHGEKVGVGTLLCLEKYAGMVGAQPHALEAAVAGFTDWSAEQLSPVFGPLAEQTCEENSPNCLHGIRPGAITQNWQQIQDILRKQPNQQTVRAQLEHIHAKTTLEDIGIDSGKKSDILKWSPWVRNRLTFMRILQLVT